MTNPWQSERAGRPPDPAADQAIIDATLDLLGEVGHAEVTIDEVARRAKVGRPTVYRRWPNKKALVVAAFVNQWPPVPRPRTATRSPCCTD